MVSSIYPVSTSAYRIPQSNIPSKTNSTLLTIFTRCTHSLDSTFLNPLKKWGSVILSNSNFQLGLAALTATAIFSQIPLKSSPLSNPFSFSEKTLTSLAGCAIPSLIKPPGYLRTLTMALLCFQNVVLDAQTPPQPNPTTLSTMYPTLCTVLGNSSSSKVVPIPFFESFNKVRNFFISLFLGPKVALINIKKKS